MAEKTTHIQIDWQQKPEGGLFICFRRKVVENRWKILKASRVEGGRKWKGTTQWRYSEKLGNQTVLYFRRGEKDESPAVWFPRKDLRLRRVLQTLGQGFQFTRELSVLTPTLSFSLWRYFCGQIVPFPQCTGSDGKGGHTSRTRGELIGIERRFILSADSWEFQKLQRRRKWSGGCLGLEGLEGQRGDSHEIFGFFLRRWKCSHPNCSEGCTDPGTYIVNEWMVWYVDYVSVKLGWVFL